MSNYNKMFCPYPQLVTLKQILAHTVATIIKTHRTCRRQGRPEGAKISRTMLERLVEFYLMASGSCWHSGGHHKVIGPCKDKYL